MVREYLGRADLAAQDLRFAFHPGDRVILRQKIPGKLQKKAMGPYSFLRYTGHNQLGAEILDHQGRCQRVALANLLPYQGQEPRDRPARPYHAGLDPTISGDTT